jgi:hypoxanthine-guanine phosphoribosyltransferase
LIHLLQNQSLIYPTQINNPQHLQSLAWMTILGVKLNQKKGQKNPEKTKKIEEDIQDVRLVILIENIKNTKKIESESKKPSSRNEKRSLSIVTLRAKRIEIDHPCQKLKI